MSCLFLGSGDRAARRASAAGGLPPLERRGAAGVTGESIFDAVKP